MNLDGCLWISGFWGYGVCNVVLLLQMKNFVIDIHMQLNAQNRIPSHKHTCKGWYTH